ncbi:ribonuclease PH [Dehalogenimonas sp. THU2]|uniref:ribonuclease PH n=1 Tax=Dehalogenimonas sp. THU2 TaxID=3151121 RepID=UPI00321849E1
MSRIDNRAPDELRAIKITPGFQSFAEGSVLIEQGQTRVICSVSMEDRVPAFLRNSGTGWVTAEYAMLPRATSTRTPRESATKISGRSQEIQRLVGRSLRAVTDMSALGERNFVVDCDVLQADAGTRTAAITGGYVALFMAFNRLLQLGVIKKMPLKSQVAAVSVSMYKGEILLDPSFEEDCNADSDFNLVMNSNGEFIEIQGTAEKRAYSRGTIDSVLSLADKGIRQIFEIQAAAVASL